MGIISSVKSAVAQRPPKTETVDPAKSQSATQKPTGVAANTTDSIDRDTVRTDQAKAAGPVDFKNMTQDQQYDYLQKLTVANASGDKTAWKTGDKECNIVGLRGFKDGAAADNIPDQYNDTVYVCRMNNGKKEVYAFDASVDPGSPGADKATWNPNGNTHLAEGFYRDSWGKGPVTGGETGLRQTGWLNVNIDKNGDGQISGDEANNVPAGSLTQLQFHRGSDGDVVGRSSAGCQVIKSGQYDDFQKLINESPQQAYSYLMIDSSKIPPQNGPFERKVKLHYGDLDSAGRCDQHGCFNYGDRKGNLQKGVNEYVPPIEGEGGIGIIQTPYKGWYEEWLRKRSTES